MGRLKRAPVLLSPVCLSRNNDHVTGMIRLLTIAVHVLSLLGYGIRYSLSDAPHEGPLRG